MLAHQAQRGPRIHEPGQYSVAVFRPRQAQRAKPRGTAGIDGFWTRNSADEQYFNRTLNAYMQPDPGRKPPLSSEQQ